MKRQPIGLGDAHLIRCLSLKHEELNSAIQKLCMAQQLMRKESMNVKESKEGLTGAAFGGSQGKGDMK